MAVEYKGQCITLKAAADLSTSQFCIVKVDSSGEAALAVLVTDKPIGILQNNPVSGSEAEVMIGGVSKIKSSVALAKDAEVTADASGRGTTLTVAAGGTVYNYLVGRCLEASTAANGIAAVGIYPFGQRTLV